MGFRLIINIKRSEFSLNLKTRILLIPHRYHHLRTGLGPIKVFPKA